MSDLSKKPPPNYAPVYAAALYPELAVIARSHGYALAVHGSLARDFDLICVPWVEFPSTPQEVVESIINRFCVQIVGKENPSNREHGRQVWSLSIGYGECALDLSFMPVLTPTSPSPPHAVTFCAMS